MCTMPQFLTYKPLRASIWAMLEVDNVEQHRLSLEPLISSFIREEIEP